MNKIRERRIGMKKIYEEPVVDIEKFQFFQVLGISRDDPDVTITDPFGPIDPGGDQPPVFG